MNSGSEEYELSLCLIFIARSIKQIHQMDDLQMVQLLSMDMCCHILKLMGNTSSM